MKKVRKRESEKARWLLQSFGFLCVFCAFAGNIFAQNLETLAEQIKFGTTEIKRDTLSQIRNLRNENASRIAIPALSDKEEIVRATAAFSVIYLPKDEAFNALSPLLVDKSELVRRETAYALGKNQNVSAVNLLIQTFQRDKISDVKNACIVALGEIGDVSAINFLTQILKQKPSDKNEFLRRSVSRSIGQIAQIIQIKKSQIVTPKDFLPDKYQEIELPKYEKLTDEFPIFRQSVSVLIQILQNPKESNDTKREAAFALGAIGDESAISILETHLNNQDYYLAEICKESLRKIQILPAKDTK
ncbi:MAG TPA: HEAT repeat domain-containing protein [Pyrinomonadaceae bacterium]|nr:HEAT repeat domain-containing protein [Pyrinomonadaceae bacterium]